MSVPELIQLLLKIGVVFALVLLNGFFVAAEFALVKLRDTQLEPLIKQGHRRAKLAREILSNLDAYISATQLGITLVSLGTGAMVAPLYEALLAPIFAGLRVTSPEMRNGIALGVGFVVNTFLLVVVGELAPKSLAIRKTLPTTLWVAQPLIWFSWITYPFVWLLNFTAQRLLSQLGIQPVTENELMHSEEEMRLLLGASQRHVGAPGLSRDIVLNAFDLNHRIVREVMRPRHEIVCLSTESTIAECLEIAEKTRFSRFPLCRNGDLDKSLATIHIKDLYAMRLRARSGADLLSAGKKIIYVPETARLVRLLQFFLERRLHLAVVVDEYGGTVGMVTLENILEELVGQIQDEFDQEKPLQEKIGQDTWSIAGALPIRDLAELVGETVIDDEVTTTSGLVTRRLGGFPKVGDVLTLGAFELRVESLDGARVDRLRLSRIAPPPAEPA
jgi:CBS domain containing-hemolysin-like protein